MAKNILILLIIATVLATVSCQKKSGEIKMNIESGFAEVNSTRLFYELKGEGHPLVLIHSGLMDRRMWDQQFHLLAERYRVIRYNIRGYEKSADAKEKFSHIEDLYRLLKFLQVDRAHILGLSLGGMIAIDFTLEHPHMVAALIPVAAGLNGYPYADSEKLGAKFQHIIKAVKEEKPDEFNQTVLKFLEKH